MNLSLFPAAGEIDSSIAIICHRPTWTNPKQGYYNLAVGDFCQMSSCSNQYSKDSSNTNNISSKNQYYSELTGLHAIANQTTITHNKITGLVHYRRRFLDPSNRIAYKLLQKTIIDNAFNTFLGAQAESMHDKLVLQMELKKKSIAKMFKAQGRPLAILPKKSRFRKTLYEHYSLYHPREDIDACRTALARIHPGYIESYDYTMNSKSMYCYNMIIAELDTIKGYSQWLFSLLSELENTLNFEILDKRVPYQRRAFGFLSERLLNVYLLYHRGLAIKELPHAFLKTA